MKFVEFVYKYKLQEHQRVAVGLGNAHFIFIRQVSSDAATLRCGRCDRLIIIIINQLGLNLKIRLCSL